MNNSIESDQSNKAKAMKEFIEAKKSNPKNTTFNQGNFNKSVNTAHDFSTQKNHHVKHG